MAASRLRFDLVFASMYFGQLFSPHGRYEPWNERTK
jgi:hypothetical protein